MYTTMLSISAVAIVIAIVLLMLEWGDYDYDTSPTGMRDSRSAAAETIYLARTAPASIETPRDFDPTRLARSKGCGFTVRVA